MTDFHFNVHMDGKITFEIHYEPGVLPEVFPEARARVTRAAKAAANAAAKAVQEATPSEESPEAATKEETALALIPEAPVFAAPVNTKEVMAATETAEEEVTNEEPNEEPATMEILYNVTGPRRKELEAAVGDFIGAKPKYMKAPTYAFTVEGYTIGRNGTLTGAENKALIESLAAQGFTAA